MSQGSRQNRQFALTYDQRLLLDMYINFYNHTTRQMDALYDLQSEIRGHINQIVGLTPFRNNSNRNFNESFTNNHNHHHQNNSNRRNNQNRNQNSNETQPPSTNSRVVYIEGIPYLLDLANSTRLRNPTNPNVANMWQPFYDNITVAPTRTQIENSTRIVQFSQVTSPINSSCPISLERFEENSNVTQILHCGHIFTPTGIES